MDKKNPTPNRMTNLLQKSREVENKVKAATSADIDIALRSATIQEENTSHNTQIEPIKIQSEIDNIEKMPNEHNTISLSSLDITTTKRNDRLVTMLVYEDYRNEFKTISNAFTISGKKITAQDLLAQAITEFFLNHKEEIKKVKKKLIG